MIILDSNIIIYSLHPEFQGLRDYLKGKDLYCSIISKIEVLGYHKLNKEELSSFERLFAQINIFPFSDRVALEAIKLRQQHRIMLGDSIIAATALLSGAELITANVKDFEWIDGLDVINPL